MKKYGFILLLIAMVCVIVHAAPPAFGVRNNHAFGFYGDNNRRYLTGGGGGSGSSDGGHINRDHRQGGNYFDNDRGLGGHNDHNYGIKDTRRPGPVHEHGHRDVIGNDRVHGGHYGSDRGHGGIIRDQHGHNSYGGNVHGEHGGSDRYDVNKGHDTGYARYKRELHHEPGYNSDESKSSEENQNPNTMGTPISY